VAETQCFGPRRGTLLKSIMKQAPMKQAKLPSLDHLLMKDFEHVYEPSDDTFLLCDALENDRDKFKAVPPRIVLEVGCGSGCVITFLTMLLKEECIDSQSFATDINPIAVSVANRTAEANEVSNVGFIRGCWLDIHLFNFLRIGLLCY
jgi:methylase of polypeptide subunit release factors